MRRDQKLTISLLLELHVAAVARQPVGSGWHGGKVEEQRETPESPKQVWS